MFAVSRETFCVNFQSPEYVYIPKLILKAKRIMISPNVLGCLCSRLSQAGLIKGTTRVDPKGADVHSSRFIEHCSIEKVLSCMVYVCVCVCVCACMPQGLSKTLK
jgi:hypothetical protein